MSNYNLQIQKNLARAEEANWPKDKIKFIKEAISIADAHNDIEWGFDLRLNLMQEEKRTSGCIESFPALAWLIQAYEQEPDLFSEEEFLWEYKWMMGSAYTTPQITLEQIENISEDYKVRMERNGFSLRPYYNSKLNEALRTGDVAGAQKYLALRNETLRDNMCDCEACELDDEVETILIGGDFNKALVMAKPLLNKTYTCAHVPFLTMCKIAAKSVETGEAQAGKEMMEAIENEMQDMDFDTSQVIPIGNIIKYLTYNDIEKAWTYYETYSHWNIDSEPFFDFSFSKNMLHLLSKEPRETVSLKLNPSFALYNSGDTYKVKDLYNYYLQNAQSLAKLFDERNGNDLLHTVLEKELAFINK